MAQDIISDALNQIMNAKKSRKSSVNINRTSNFLMEVLKVAKKEKYLDFSINEKSVKIEFSLNKCSAIKPRFNVGVEDIDKYVKRFLPARDFGVLIISTNNGLVTHKEAIEKNLGGSLIAYFY
ncbi:MAG: 30S ribosomal protein S8 [Nanoarchaeota archaeon]